MKTMRFECPHCTQHLEVEAGQSGETVECPTCGKTIPLPSDLNRPPRAPGPTGKDCPFCAEPIHANARKCKHCGEFLDGSRPTAPTLPPSGKNGEIERVLWKGNPSGWYYAGHWFLGILTLPLMGLGLLFILYAVLDQKNRVYTLTNQTVMEKSGIISRKIHEVSLRDIRSIHLNQKIMERLFNLGSISIGSAGTAGVEVEFKGVSNPGNVSDRIRAAKDSSV